MNKDQVEGKWSQLMGRIQAKWGKLTHDDASMINGRRKELSGRLQELYGLGKEEAELALAEIEKSAN